jgi:hypothetical protein
LCHSFGGVGLLQVLLLLLLLEGVQLQEGIKPLRQLLWV